MFVRVKSSFLVIIDINESELFGKRVCLKYADNQLILVLPKLTSHDGGGVIDETLKTVNFLEV